MAAIHRIMQTLGDRVRSIREAISRRARWVAASSYRLLLAILISIFALLFIAFIGAIASYGRTDTWSDEDFQRALAAALDAHAVPTFPPVAILDATVTPFAPVAGTPIVIPTESPPENQVAEAHLQPVDLQPTESPAPSTDFYGINFGNNKDRVTIKIIPNNKKINSGKPINITFLPGKRCNFGDNHACVFSYLNENLGNTIFLTVHSGEGGEAQSYRNALEGTLINSGAYTPKKVQSNMNALDGAKVVITQGKKSVDGFELSFVSRIPPRSLKKYLSTSVLSVLGMAASIRGNLNYQTAPDQPQLVFETCGWRLPGEALGPVSTATSAAIYVTVIQKSTED
jgi:hypothetical protein